LEFVSAHPSFVRKREADLCGTEFVSGVLTQTLKPSSVPAQCGTAEAVPFVESFPQSVKPNPDAKPKLFPGYVFHVFQSEDALKAIPSASKPDEPFA
jgi:hypothetical protein